MVERLPPFKARVVVPLFRPVFSTLIRVLTLRVSPLRIRGSALVPREGGLIVVANHLADMDPLMLQYACPRPIRFMAKRDLFDWKIIGPILRFVHAFPIERNSADRKAIKYAIELAKSGEVVCVFPEGELSETGKLQRLLPGVSLIIRQAKVPAICCRLDGTNLIVPYGTIVPRFRAGATLSARWSEPRILDSLSTEEMLAWMEANLQPEEK